MTPLRIAITIVAVIGTSIGFCAGYGSGYRDGLRDDENEKAAIEDGEEHLLRWQAKLAEREERIKHREALHTNNPMVAEAETEDVFIRVADYQSVGLWADGGGDELSGLESIGAVYTEPGYMGMDEPAAFVPVTRWWEWKAAKPRPPVVPDEPPPA